MEKPSVNYEAWAVDLCSLLDRIEMVADDEEAVRELCHGRFALDEKHGLEIVFLGEQADTVQ